MDHRWSDPSMMSTTTTTTTTTTNSVVNSSSSSQQNNVTIIDGRGGGGGGGGGVIGLRQQKSRKRMGDRSRKSSGGNGVHKMLGGGIVADVILWRRSDLTVGILSSTIGTYIFFQFSGQTLLSFFSKVALLLTSVLFFWAKTATLLRRQLPPLPDMSISEESMNAFASRLGSCLNAFLATAHDIAHGRETHLYLTTATCLCLLSIVGSFMNFVTVAFTSLIVILTVPALYDKYEDHIERGIVFAKRGYERLEAAYANIVKGWNSA